MFRLCVDKLENLSFCLCCFWFWPSYVKGHVGMALIILNHIYWKSYSKILNIYIFLFKIVFSSQPSDDESSSDETSHQPSPAFRRRRARKKTVSSSESEERLLPEQEAEPSKELCKRQFSSGLNKCVILALVIAISMGFGHFYGKYLEICYT